MSTLTRESLRVIGERRAAARADPAAFAKQKDLLALFLGGVNEQGKPYSDKELRDVVLNFVIAGRDTTACTLTWCLFILATHPEVQAKLQTEVDAADHSDGRHRSDSHISADGGDSGSGSGEGGADASGETLELPRRAPSGGIGRNSTSSASRLSRRQKTATPSSSAEATPRPSAILRAVEGVVGAKARFCERRCAT